MGVGVEADTDEDCVYYCKHSCCRDSQTSDELWNDPEPRVDCNCVYVFEHEGVDNGGVGVGEDERKNTQGVVVGVCGSERDGAGVSLDGMEMRDWRETPGRFDGTWTRQLMMSKAVAAKICHALGLDGESSTAVLHD